MIKDALTGNREQGIFLKFDGKAIKIEVFHNGLLVFDSYLGKASHALKEFKEILIVFEESIMDDLWERLDEKPNVNSIVSDVESYLLDIGSAVTNIESELSELKD